MNQNNLISIQLRMLELISLINYQTIVFKLKRITFQRRCFPSVLRYDFNFWPGRDRNASTRLNTTRTVDISQYDTHSYLGIRRTSSVTNLLEKTNAYQQTLPLQCMNASALTVKSSCLNWNAHSRNLANRRLGYNRVVLLIGA